MTTAADNHAWWRKLRTGYTTALLAALLMFDALSIADGPMRCCCSHPPSFPLRGTSDGLAIIQEDEAAQPEEIVGEAVVWGRRRQISGAWAATARTVSHSLKVYLNDGSSPTPEEVAKLRPVVADALAQDWGDTELADLLRAGDGSTSRPIISGYIHNAATLGLLAALFWSMAWIPERRRAARRDLARSRGLCAACSYDLTGLPTGRCPECGSPTTD